MKSVVIIPARYASKRLPAKALKIIGNKTLINHVWNRAKEANIGPVFIATDNDLIAENAREFGADVLMTSPSCKTGSDRVAQALKSCLVDYDAIINVQGDLPFVSSKEIVKVLEPLKKGYDVGTLISCMEEERKLDPSCVKAIVSSSNGEDVQRCHWFCRASIPYGHYHLGVYSYTKESLARFSKTPPHPLELCEKLEQIRFLTLGMTIGASLISSLSLEVNTKEDLERARKHKENEDLMA